ncbi:MAG: FlgK family flagellar hook-associated protein [Acidimicrobiales bacterium]
MSPADGHRTGGSAEAAGSFHRLRESVLSGHAATLTSAAAAHDVAAAAHAEIIAAVGGSAPGGVLDRLRSVFTAFAHLADAPTDRSARREVTTAATVLAERINHVDEALERCRREAATVASDQLEHLNAQLVRVAAANRTIRTGAPGDRSTDADPDDVDRALGELVDRADVMITREADGRHRIVLDDHPLVADATAWPLAMVERPGAPAPELRLVVRRHRGRAVRIADGTIGGAIEVAGRVVPDERRRLQQVVAALVAEVNEIHRAGVALDGSTGRDLFTPGPEPLGLRLAPDIAARPERLAAAGPGEDRHGARTARLLAGLAEAADGPLITVTEAIDGLQGRRQAAAGRARATRAAATRIGTIARATGAVGDPGPELAELARLQRHFEGAARAADAAATRLPHDLTSPRRSP